MLFCQSLEVDSSCFCLFGLGSEHLVLTEMCTECQTDECRKLASYVRSDSLFSSVMF